MGNFLRATFRWTKVHGQFSAGNSPVGKNLAGNLPSTKLKCDICNKDWNSQLALDWHIKNCHSNIKCDLCHKTFGNKTLMKRHQAVVHLDTALYCNTCTKPRVFTTKEYYQRHMKLEHDIDVF